MVKTMNRIAEKLGIKGHVFTGKTLIIAIGNSGRSDDGLGWAFADSILDKGEFFGDVVYSYQLQIEDADLISKYDTVIFVDAYSQLLENGACLERVDPLIVHSFSTHALDPAAVVGLCQELYESTPEAWVLKIEGHEWDLNVGLSKHGEKNLVQALECFHA